MGCNDSRPGGPEQEDTRAELSRDGMLMDEADKVVAALVHSSKIRLRSSDWDEVHTLLKRAVEAGIEMERNL